MMQNSFHFAAFQIPRPILFFSRQHPCLMYTPPSSNLFHPPPTNTDDAYIFQPSPHRQSRQHLRNVQQVQPSVTQSEFPPTLVAPVQTTHKKRSQCSSSSSSSSSRSKRNKPILHFEDHSSFIHGLNNLSGDPLDQVGGGQLVTFRGSPENAHLMIIGDMPSEDDDATGVPFAGRAGRLLDTIFSHGGFDVNRQLYITNVIKRRTPDGRPPSRTEISFFLPYTLEEVRLVQPAIVVLAGAVAARALLGKRVTISSVHGSWFGGEDDVPWYIPVFHPLYLLRKQSMKKEMMDDFLAIRAKYIQLCPDDPLLPLPPPPSAIGITG